MPESPRKLWIALFSQTGSELVAICDKLGRYPDAVLTNNLKRDFSDNVFEQNGMLHKYDSESLFNVLRQIGDFYGEEEQDVVITLHGFLRILPQDICERFEIYNGHPGDIITYPELKGKDPQAKALELGHKTARAVLHEVTPIVDDGEIVAATPFIMIEDMTLEQVISDLKTLSVIEWCHLLKEKLS